MSEAILKNLMTELREGQLIDFVKAKKEQQEVASLRQERRFFGDQGEVKFQVHPKFYHYWGNRLGYVGSRRSLCVNSYETMKSVGSSRIVIKFKLDMVV